MLSLISQFKNIMIRKFEEIEDRLYRFPPKESAATIPGKRSVPNDTLLTEIHSYNELFATLSDQISSACNNTTGNNAYSECFSQAAKEIRVLLKNLYLKVNTCLDDNDKTTGLSEEIKAAAGEIALKLRFDILSEQKQVTEGASFEDAIRQLSLLGWENGNFYPVKPLWQYSLRKRLPVFEFDDTAIVIQGPVIYENDFTIETIYRYRRIYPNVLIILSTWKEDLNELLRWKAESVGTVVIANEKPAPGPYNLIFQLVSSISGIQYACSFNNIKYVMKTRTDQRYFLPDFLVYFKNLIRQFPPEDKTVESRIIFQGWLNSRWSVPFYISDFLTFGSINELLQLYTSALDKLNSDDYQIIPADVTLDLLKFTSFENSSELFRWDRDKRLKRSREITDIIPAEAYIVRAYYEDRYLHRKLNENDDMFEHYWDFVKDGTIIADADHLIFYWHKYTQKNISYNTCEADGGLTHSLWLDLYMNGFD